MTGTLLKQPSRIVPVNIIGFSTHYTNSANTVYTCPVDSIAKIVGTFTVVSLGTNSSCYLSVSAKNIYAISSNAGFAYVDICITAGESLEVRTAGTVASMYCNVFIEEYGV